MSKQADRLCDLERRMEALERFVESIRAEHARKHPDVTRTPTVWRNECNHCYCQLESVASTTVGSTMHVRCCKCGDRKAVGGTGVTVSAGGQ